MALLAIESAISFPGWPEWLGIKKIIFVQCLAKIFTIEENGWEDLVDADGVEAASADSESEEIS